MAKTRSSGAIPEDSTIGIIIPAAVKPDTVADPTIIRIMAAMSQTNIIGEIPMTGNKFLIEVDFGSDNDLFKGASSSNDK